MRVLAWYEFAARKESPLRCRVPTALMASPKEIQGHAYSAYKGVTAKRLDLGEQRTGKHSKEYEWCWKTVWVPVWVCTLEKCTFPVYRDRKNPHPYTLCMTIHFVYGDERYRTATVEDAALNA